MYGSNHDGVDLTGGQSLHALVFISVRYHVLGCAFRVSACAWVALL